LPRSGVLLSGTGVLLSGIFNNIKKRSSYVYAYKDIFENYLKYWGSIVGGFLLSLEFYGRHTALTYSAVNFRKEKY
jgi:hypothetical protein